MGPLAMPIFHHCTKFGEKMLIDTDIMAQNRHQGWRPSSILDLLHHHIDHPRSLCDGPHQPVKFYANPVHSFEDMAIWIFCRISLKCLFTPPNLGFWGSQPQTWLVIIETPKGTFLAGTALTCQFWWRSVHWCDLSASWRNKKRKETYSGKLGVRPTNPRWRSDAGWSSGDSSKFHVSRKSVEWLEWFSRYGGSKFAIFYYYGLSLI